MKTKWLQIVSCTFIYTFRSISFRGLLKPVLFCHLRSEVRYKSSLASVALFFAKGECGVGNGLLDTSSSLAIWVCVEAGFPIAFLPRKLKARGARVCTATLTGRRFCTLRLAAAAVECDWVCFCDWWLPLVRPCGCVLWEEGRLRAFWGPESSRVRPNCAQGSPQVTRPGCRWLPPNRRGNSFDDGENFVGRRLSDSPLPVIISVFWLKSAVL